MSIFIFDDDDDDDNDDDVELLLWTGWPKNGVKPYFWPGPLSDVFTMAKSIWTSVESEFRLCQMCRTLEL